MLKIGRIAVYDQASGNGLILINETNEKLNFSINEWVDKIELPKFEMIVKIEETGISTYNPDEVQTVETIKDEEVKQKISFNELRNILYKEFNRIYPNSKILKDIHSTNFTIENSNKGIAEINLKDDGSFEFKHSNIEFSKEFIERLETFDFTNKSEYKNNKNISSTHSQEINTDTTSKKQEEGNQTLGIVSLVLALVGLFVAPIILEPIALITGIIAKNTIGKISAIISGIYLALIVLGLIVGTSFVLGNM